jgi:hypothetical protein
MLFRSPPATPSKWQSDTTRRKCMGIEPTAGILCPPLDLKSRRPTRTCPLPTFNLKDFLFKVNPSTSQHKCWGCSGLTLSGALHTALKSGTWRSRTGQGIAPPQYPLEIMKRAISLRGSASCPKGARASSADPVNSLAFFFDSASPNTDG